MREGPGGFDPTVKAALDEAKALIASGDIVGGLAAYQRTYDDAIGRGDHYHASVVAHMAGVAEPDAAAKHQWNVDALREAYAAGDRRHVAGFYASLFGNLAFSHAMLGNLDDALRYQALASTRVQDIEPGAYRDQVAAATERNLARIHARIAERRGSEGDA
jgi:hypothetical protein